MVRFDTVGFPLVRVVSMGISCRGALSINNVERESLGIAVSPSQNTLSLPTFLPVPMPPCLPSFPEFFV